MISAQCAFVALASILTIPLHSNWPGAEVYAFVPIESRVLRKRSNNKDYSRSFGIVRYIPENKSSDLPYSPPRPRVPPPQDDKNEHRETSNRDGTTSEEHPLETFVGGDEALDLLSSELGVQEVADQTDDALLKSSFSHKDGTSRVITESTKKKELKPGEIKAEELDGDEALRYLTSELGVRKLVGLDTEALFPLNLLLERTLDTVEDAVVHLRRIPYDLGWQPEPVPKAEDNRPTVVILGSGWAAHALMKVADSFKLRLIVVSPSNHFVFTPMLASASVGTVEYRSMTEAVRAANPMIEGYVEGMATDVDLKKKVITVKLNSLLEDLKEGESPTIEISYDKLIVAVGAKVADSNVPGAATKCLRLKSCDDARRLRESVGECFEYASRPDVAGNSEEVATERSRRVTFLIVGGGPTGVELAGELSDFAKDITKPRVGAYPRLADDVRVILAHGGPDLLPPFETGLRKEALKALKKRGVEVRLNTKVTEVADGHVELETTEKDENGNVIGTKEETLPVGLTVWCAGTAPVPFVDTLLKKLPESARGVGGRINVDKWLRPQTDDPETFGSVLVLGDAASFKDGEGDTSFLPQTAQVAGQQGAYVARLLCRGYDLSATPPKLPTSSSLLLSTVKGEAIDANSTAYLEKLDPLLSNWLKLRGLDVAPPFGFLNLGLLAYVGGGEALSQVQIGDVPVFSYAGSVAFILWRSVYLVKQVATRNRVLVTFDWIKSALFGRDITRL